MSTPLVTPSVASYLVEVNTPTNLGVIPDGATILNTDADNPVYVSSDPSVGPLSGVRIGPLGTLSWSRASSCYAIAVTASVSIQVSQLVSNPVNPVDTAEAVAAILAVQGVPSKLLTSFIGSYVVTPGNTSPNIDVSEYSSLFLSLEYQNNIEPLPYSCWVTFLFNVNGVPYYQQPINVLTPIDDPTQQVQVPATGSLVRFTNNTGSETLTINVWGINRVPLPPAIPSWSVQGSVTLASGTTSNVQLSTVPAPGRCMLDLLVTYGDTNCVPLTLSYVEIATPYSGAVPDLEWQYGLTYKWHGMISFTTLKSMLYIGPLVAPTAPVTVYSTLISTLP